MRLALVVIQFCRRIAERWHDIKERAEERRNGIPLESTLDKLRRLGV